MVFDATELLNVNSIMLSRQKRWCEQQKETLVENFFFVLLHFVLVGFCPRGLHHRQVRYTAVTVTVTDHPSTVAANARFNYMQLLNIRALP
jgi:hypothetical protein